jgi:hypothetical protein
LRYYHAAVSSGRLTQALGALVVSYGSFIALLLSLVPILGVACDCVRPSDKLEDDVTLFWKASVAVVAAEAVTIETHNTIEYGTSIEKQKVTWRVLQSWRGLYKAGSLVSTDTAVTCCLCGVRVAAGDKRLLYLQHSFTVSECSVGRSLEASQEQIPLLNKLKAAALHEAGT